jgi:LysM domain-containing protein
VHILRKLITAFLIELAVAALVKIEVWPAVEKWIDRVAGTKYTVLQDDNLSTISRKEYGTEQYSWLIWQANRALIKDPDKLRPGWTLTIPSSSFTVKQKQEALREYNALQRKKTAGARRKDLGSRRPSEPRSDHEHPQTITPRCRCASLNLH